MARAIRSGAISFGLVHISVQLYSATESREVQFHQFEMGTGQRVRYKPVGEETDEEVPWEKVEKGYVSARRVWRTPAGEYLPLRRRIRQLGKEARVGRPHEKKVRVHDGSVRANERGFAERKRRNAPGVE